MCIYYMISCNNQEIVPSIALKMRVKMKNRSHRYDIIKLYQGMVTNTLNINCFSV